MSATGKWKDPQVLLDLVMGAFTVLGPIPTDKQAALVKYMEDKGHSISWEAIR